MKKAKLKKELAALQAAHKKSSAAYKDLSRRSSDAKKVLKERKRAFNDARRTYKSVRKAYRELECELKDVRREHLRNNERLQKYSKKLGKSGDVSEKAAASKTRAKTGGAAAKRKRTASSYTNVPAAEPAIAVVS
ncbi:MAG TPA: hypothetical protein VF773_06745 [Verrucomicrobiae bacterium]